MAAYYNEIDPYAAQWLRNLIAAGHIPAGDVDTRSIVEVQPDDLKDYTQCHFFAGIGGWAYAARLAGWPDDRPLWTGSCPCQPFSAAGKQAGTADERHLWPEFFRLIAVCRPPVVFGEQVASKLGREWLAGVFADLESVGYAAAGADLCAASCGAPHIRQRLWWLADAGDDGREPGRNGGDVRGVPEARSEAQSEGGKRALSPERGSERGAGGRLADADRERCREAWSAESRGGAGGSVSFGGLADAPGKRHDGQHSLLWSEEGGRDRKGAVSQAAGGGAGGRLGHSQQPGLEGHTGHEPDGNQPGRHDQDAGRSASPAGRDSWAGAIWTPCADGKSRRIEPGIEPLAHGVPARVGKLRAYGNAIVPVAAAAFIEAYYTP
jgi:DNA (cytosine-5)-methyltransferase 1